MSGAECRRRQRTLSPHVCSVGWSVWPGLSVVVFAVLGWGSAHGLPERTTGAGGLGLRTAASRPRSLMRWTSVALGAESTRSSVSIQRPAGRSRPTSRPTSHVRQLRKPEPRRSAEPRDLSAIAAYVQARRGVWQSLFFHRICAQRVDTILSSSKPGQHMQACQGIVIVPT